MPRPKSRGNAAGAAATARWRKTVREARRPEVDAVDSAISAAVAVWRYQALLRCQEKNLERISALEGLAIHHLVSRGSDPGEAERAVLRRIRSDRKTSIAPLVGKEVIPSRPPVTT